MAETVKLSIVATFKQGKSPKVGYAHEVRTVNIDLSKQDTDTGARIGVIIGAFLERNLDPKEGREDRELISLSHSIILVPS